MIRLLADENIVGLERLSSPELEIVTAPGRSLSAEQLIGFDALWVRSVTTVDEMLLSHSKLRFVGTATAGKEHVNQQALARRNITFASAPGANANAVVEYVLAALAEFQTPWKALDNGETLGIVGYGYVGRQLAKVARVLGWRVCVYDPWLDSGNADSANSGDSMAQWATLQEVLRCRVISLHCDLHRRAPWPSYHLIDGGVLAHLDESQWIVNASRGSVVDNAALLKRLRLPSPPACVLDVWEGEPAVNTALLDCPSLLLATPHIAGYSWDSKWQATQMLYAAMAEEGLVSKQIADAADALEALELSEQNSAGVMSAATAFIQQRYRIRNDDQQLRALQHLSKPARAKGFDDLRRDYPVRREVRGSTLRYRTGVSKPLLKQLEEAFDLRLETIPNSAPDNQA